MDFRYDITFCDDINCPHKDCRRHPCNTPPGLHSISNFGAFVDNYDDCEYALISEDDNE